MKGFLLILVAIVVTPQGWAEDRFVDAQPGAKHIAAPLPKSSAASPEANADAITAPKNQNIEAQYQCYTNTQGCSVSPIFVTAMRRALAARSGRTTVPPAE